MSDIQQAHYEERIRELQGEIYDLRESESAWHHAAMLVGEQLASVGPVDYYAMKAEAWRSWALDAVNALRTDWRKKQPK